MTHRPLSTKEVIERLMAEREKGTSKSEPHTSSYAHSASPRRAIGSENIDATDDPKITRRNRGAVMDKWGGDRRNEFGFVRN